jgi:uncharacterized membrane protein HdeD (DUF308 family)
VLSVLAGQRWLILLRSGLALLFGVLVLLWPDPIPPGFAALFGLYALPSGIVALIGVSRCRSHTSIARRRRSAIRPST